MTITAEPEIAPAKIPDSDVRYVLRSIVREFGSDYVYKPNKVDGVSPRCLYRDGDKPSCLVGQILYRLTPDYIPTEVSVTTQRSALYEFGYSKTAIYAMQVAQAVQDARHTWGAALTAAEAVFEYDVAAE